MKALALILFFERPFSGLDPTRLVRQHVLIYHPPVDPLAL